jgi:hypothetical protein
MEEKRAEKTGIKKCQSFTTEDITRAPLSHPNCRDSHSGKKI